DRELPHAAGRRDGALHRPRSGRRPLARRSAAAGPPPVWGARLLIVISLVVQWFADPAHWSGPDGIPQRLLEHVQISAESVAIGAVIALPIGIALGHYGRFGNVAINISNVGRGLPSFGVLVITFQVLGLGTLPILVALVALAIPPMVTNSYVGLSEVDPDVKEAA